MYVLSKMFTIVHLRRVGGPNYIKLAHVVVECPLNDFEKHPLIFTEHPQCIAYLLGESSIHTMTCHRHLKLYVVNAKVTES